MTMRNFLFLLESLTSYPAEGFFGVDDTTLNELKVVEVPWETRSSGVRVVLDECTVDVRFDVVASFL